MNDIKYYIFILPSCQYPLWVKGRFKETIIGTKRPFSENGIISIATTEKKCYIYAMKILELTNVSYSYKTSEEETIGVKNVTMDVEQGEFLVLLGHNGCGKSTLAKLLNGLLIPDSGAVSVDGSFTSDDQKIYEIRSKVGMVFQNPDNQMVASVIEDDVAFGPENLGVSREELLKRVDWALTVVGMEKYRKGTPFKLSGGQKQRVAIAAVLAMKPQVLILDESTAMLDPAGREEVLSVVKKLNKENGMTVILITHYMDEATDADRIIVMNGGQIEASGTPKEIFSDIDLIRRCRLEPPVCCGVMHKLAACGFSVNPVLSDEEAVEEICRSK